jgi:hypothetical protein
MQRIVLLAFDVAAMNVSLLFIPSSPPLVQGTL